MTFNTGKRPLAPVTFPIKNERECKWIFNYLCSSQINTIDHSAVNYEAQRKEINKSINEWNASASLKSEFVSDVLDKCYNVLIPESDFDWINKQNKRLYRWLHAYLVTFHNVPLNHNITFDSYRRDIVKYFDTCQSTLSEKKQFLLKLQGYWEKDFKIGETFEWLDGGNVKWAWKYFKSKDIPHEAISFIKESDRFDVVITMFDLWDAHIDTKRLFIVNMKKAFNQKKQRDKLDGKKAYNIVMSEDIKQKLDALAIHHDRKINQTLEHLINKEHEKLLTIQENK